MKIKNRFFALLILCLSSLLFFSCAKVDDAVEAIEVNEAHGLNDEYVEIPVKLGLSMDAGESTRTLKYKGFHANYLMYVDLVMYYGPKDEPQKYSFNLKFHQSQLSLEGIDRTKYANILLHIKKEDLGKNFCFTLLGANEGSFESQPGWVLSSKGKICTDENPEGDETILISQSTGTFSLKFLLDTVESIGEEGAKGEFFLNFKPNIYAEGFEYNAVVFLSREVDGEYFEIFGKYFESVNKEFGIDINSPSLECGQYLIKIYAYVPEDAEEDNAGKCFGMFSTLVEVYGNHKESYYVVADRTFSTYHVVPSAPDYSVAKSKAIELANQCALTD